MLILTRAENQEIVVGENVRIKVLDILGNRVRIGITAPPEIEVDRAEVRESKEAHGRNRDRRGQNG